MQLALVLLGSVQLPQGFRRETIIAGNSWRVVTPKPPFSIYDPSLAFLARDYKDRSMRPPRTSAAHQMTLKFQINWLNAASNRLFFVPRRT